VRFDRLDLNLLVALDAILSERHVTRAGERLGVGQPAMSGALSRLRTHFEDPLVIRAGAALILTPLGERLAGPVRDLLLKTKAVLDERPSFDPATSVRHFSIVSSDYINALILDALSLVLAEQAPQISVEMTDPVPGRFSDELENGEVDILIIPRFLTTPEHPAETLVEDRFVCVAWNDSTVGESISLGEYLTRPHVAANFGRPGGESIEALHLKKLGLERRVVMAVPQFSALPELVVGTERIATVPRRLAVRMAETLPVRIVTPDIDFPLIEEIVQWHKYRDEDPAVIWLRKVLQNLARRLEARRSEDVSLKK
jgi:DNA-binding transcriptional LysR family regulator